MSVNARIRQTLARLTLEHRESGYHHHSYDEDMAQYELVRRGDMKALAVCKRMFEGPTTGSVADDPVRNYQYLFVASITLACRFCIEGGMPTETAFNLSDLYIHQVDRCRTREEIYALHETMIRDYTTRMQGIARREVFSRPVYRCMDYVEQHLQEPLTVKTLAEALGLAPTYLSALFKKETGVALSEHIRRVRVDNARMLLQYTDFTCLEIAEYLCFASESHFSQVFRQYTGETPREYRRNHAQRHWSPEQEA